VAKPTRDVSEKNCTAWVSYVQHLFCQCHGPPLEWPSLFWTSCFSLFLKLTVTKLDRVRSLSRPFVRDTIPSTYNWSGVTQSPTLWISSTSFRWTRRTEREAKSLPSSDTDLKITGRPRQKVRLPLALNIAVDLAALLFCVQKIRRSCFGPKTSYLRRVCLGFFFKFFR